MTTTAGAIRRVGPRAAARRPSSVVLLPLFFTALVGAFALTSTVRQNSALLGSITGAFLLLLVGVGALWVRARSRPLAVEVSLRAQHYLQASMQGIVFAFWGWYWRPVYEAVPLVGAQLAFAYAFDMLLVWWRRDRYQLGFGPFPVIFSINLFLWFRPDWFYLQFCMIALGFAAKELIRWERDGRRVHVFNPSSFPLAVFSIGLILTGTSGWTYGQDIARTQFNPPHIYLVLFLIGLPGQLLFGVTTMTMSAVLTTYAFGLGYFAVTGAYYFVDSYIPVAVFLGMHLLFTDPSTSPRTELGRIVFGMLYGLGTIVLYALLRQAGIPAFYDKLLPVPILNLSVRVIDRMARSPSLRWLDPARFGRSLPPRRRNLAYVAVWTSAFIALSAAGGVGDHHPGHSVLFWQQACQRNAVNACENLSVILDTYCRDGSSWACNEVGALRWHQRVERSQSFLDNFASACTLGSTAGCRNLIDLQRGSTAPPLQAAPAVQDYPVILRTGKGAIPETTPAALYGRACDEGWSSACYGLGAVHLKGDEVPRDPLRARTAFEKACVAGIGNACSDLGLMHYTGDGIPQDRSRGLEYLKRACDVGMAAACQWYTEARQ
jgi:hypothetical protein